MIKNEKTLLNMFSKQGVQELVNLVKEGLQDQGSALSLRSVHLSVPGSAFVVDGYTPFLQKNVGKKNSSRDRPDLWKQVQRIISCKTFGPCKRL